ncbi:collagenase [[Clostridium] sordellii]|uniref:collagenase n=1 Tax=Paraclostridium sordellii TaxID=1505 RepID=UPI0005DB3F63|nr:collagenase [Paeniclostridium sordellii]CEP92732.1 collagenase [[Clostridium] sordellii] [Paeniclostridium sordellii]
MKYKNHAKYIAGTLICSFGVTTIQSPILSHAMDSKNAKNINMFNNNDKEVRNTTTQNNKDKADRLTAEEASVHKKDKMIGKQSIDNVKKDKKSINYTMADLNKMSNEELVNTLEKVNWYNITDLFEYNKDAQEFYGNREKFDFLIKTLEQKGTKYTSQNHEGIPTFVEVIRAGFYLGFYNEGLSYLYELETREKCLPAMISIQKNPNFKLGENGQNEVIKSLGMLIGNSAVSVDVVNNMIPVFEQYNQDLKNNMNNFAKSDIIYNIMKGVEYRLNAYAYDSKLQPEETQFAKKIDKYIDIVSDYISNKPENDSEEWFIECGMYYTSKLYKFHSKPNQIHAKMDKVLEINEEMSWLYLKAVDLIEWYMGGTLSDGTPINSKEIKEKAKKYYLPNEYKFEDDKIVIKTGDKVTAEKVERLYWATKEVQSQFFKIIGSDKALEVGHADDILTVVIYNSPKEYKMNQVLYGYSTDNGGMYIEGEGTFYTYERTPQESIYSLEELFRHEYTHYLQSRYLIEGYFGTGDFYKDKDWRITWFEEGSAEFWAGATRTDNVISRKSMVSGISKNPSDRFTVDKLMHSKYGSWDFYNYGFAFVDFIYRERPEIFEKFTDLMITNNVAGYDKYVEELSKDVELNKGYQAYMQKLVDNYDNLTVPFVSDNYLKDHPSRDISKIKEDIDKTINLKNSKVETNKKATLNKYKVSGKRGKSAIESEKSPLFNTYTFSGIFEGGKSNGRTNDNKEMGEILNTTLKKLEQIDWSGYETVNAYHTDYKVNENGNYEFRIVFTGILPKGSQEVVNDDTFETANGPIKINSNYSGDLSDTDNKDYYYFNLDNPSNINITLENLDNKGVSWQLFHESDLNNYVAYPTTSGEVLKGDYNATKPGKYYILVYNHDKSIANYNLKVNFGNNNDDGVEQEDNNSFEKANPFNINQLIKGELDNSKDTSDYFKFEVKEDASLNINLEKTEGDGVNWLLFKDSDLENYIASPTESIDNKLNGKVDLKVGTYYLEVYGYGSSPVKYNFKVTPN